MPSMIDFAVGILSQNPTIANSPNGKELLSVIQNNDSKKGIEIAQNICNSRGMSMDQAVNEARAFFRI